MDFHQNLKQMREQRGMTQEDLAEQLGISRQSVSKWELGINEPDLPTIRSLCRILNCSYEALLEGDEPVQEQPIDKVEPKEEKIGYRVYVAQLILFITYLMSSLIFSFFPFFSIPNAGSFVYFQVAFGGIRNINLVCLLSLFVGAGISTIMGLLSFLPRRSVKLFRARDGLLIFNAVLMLFVFVFSIQASCSNIGVFVLLLNNLIFMILHFAIPSLKSKGFAKNYGNAYLKSSPIDRYVMASTLMISLAFFSLPRIESNGTTFIRVLHWSSSLIGFAALITFAILFLALPQSMKRTGIKVGALISIGISFAFGMLIIEMNLLPMIIIYLLYAIGVFVAVCLVKTRNE